MYYMYYPAGLLAAVERRVARQEHEDDDAEAPQVALAGVAFGWHYMSDDMASFVFYGITCLIRLIEVAPLFTTFEENIC